MDLKPSTMKESALQDLIVKTKESRRDSQMKIEEQNHRPLTMSSEIASTHRNNDLSKTSQAISFRGSFKFSPVKNELKQTARNAPLKTTINALENLMMT